MKIKIIDIREIISTLRISLPLIGKVYKLKRPLPISDLFLMDVVHGYVQDIAISGLDSRLGESHESRLVNVVMSRYVAGCLVTHGVLQDRIYRDLLNTGSTVVPQNDRQLSITLQNAISTFITETELAALDNMMNGIYDLELILYVTNALAESLSENPYEVYDITLQEEAIAIVVKSLGDFRILAYEDNRNG